MSLYQVRLIFAGKLGFHTDMSKNIPDIEFYKKTWSKERNLELYCWTLSSLENLQLWMVLKVGLVALS